MANDLLVEKYYNKLNEQTARGTGGKSWMDLVTGFGSGAATVYTVDSLIKLARDMMAGNRGSAEQKPESGPRYEVNYDISKEMSQSGGELPDSYYKQMADLQSQGKSATYRSSTQIRQNAMATSMARRDMNAAKQAAWDDPKVKAAMTAYKQNPNKDTAKALRDAKSLALSGSEGYKKSLRAVNAFQSGPMNLQPVERRGGGFSVGRGVGGKPIITGGSYVNPNSAEGRIAASIAAGNEPDLPRDPTTGRVKSGQKMPWELEQEQRAAGQRAYDREVGFNTSGMSQKDIEDELRSRIRQETLDEKDRLEQMPKEDFAKEVNSIVSKYKDRVNTFKSKIGLRPTSTKFNKPKSRTIPSRSDKYDEKMRGLSYSKSGMPQEATGP